MKNKILLQAVGNYRNSRAIVSCCNRRILAGNQPGAYQGKNYALAVAILPAKLAQCRKHKKTLIQAIRQTEKQLKRKPRQFG